MPSASVDGTLGFLVFVGYYLRLVEKYDTKEVVQNLMFLLFSGERRANVRFITLRRVTNFFS